jgi:CRISPR system Cascade subunit CasC
MFIELHIIQNFAPSNLNRSETGTPKDCEFGGHRRARISSQCFKRAIREEFKHGAGFSPEQQTSLATRTRLLVDALSKRLTDASRLGEKVKPEAEARRVARIALNAGGLEIKENEQTEFLVFLGEREIQAIADRCIEHWDKLMETDAAYEQARHLQEQIIQTEVKTKTGSKDEKQAAKDQVKKLKDELGKAQESAKKAIPKEIEKAVKRVLDGGQAADLALFGRMLATLPEKNIDAAAQVAHAISTHKCGVEFDFYTAVDDLLPQGETGAGMMGTVEFNSACFYRYANINFEQLIENLGDDRSLAEATIEAFFRAAINAVPTGKQNSTAAQNLPSFILAVARRSVRWSLANAFVDPATTRDGDLIGNSIKKLDKHWGQMTTMYGADQIVDQCYVALDGRDLERLNGSRVDSVNDLVTRITAAVKGA